MKTTSKLVLLGGAVIRGLHETYGGSPHNRHRSEKGGLKFAMMLMTLAAALTSYGVKGVAFEFAAYVDGKPVTTSGAVSPSRCSGIPGTFVYCAANPPSGTTIAGWSIVNGDGTFTRIPYSEGMEVLYYIVPTGQTAMKIVVECVTSKPAEEKKKKGLLLILR